MEKAQSVLKRVASKLTADRDYSEKDYAGPEGGEEGFQFWNKDQGTPKADTQKADTYSPLNDPYDDLLDLVKKHGLESLKQGFNDILENHDLENQRHDTIDQS